VSTGVLVLEYEVDQVHTARNRVGVSVSTGVSVIKYEVSQV
jgi:hypothetical protein